MSKRQKASHRQSSTSARSHNDDDRSRVITKQVNTRFILTVLGIFAALGVGVHFLHGVQVEGNAGKLKERAQAAEAEGEYEKAVTLLNQYLNFRENDYDALLHFLRLRDGLATTKAARDELLLGYQGILRRDPDRPDEAEIRQDTAAIAMSVGEFALARQQLEMLVEPGKFDQYRDKHGAELKYQLGLCCQAEGNIKEAFEAFLQVFDQDWEQQPNRYKYYLPLAALFAESYEDLPTKKSTSPKFPRTS